MNQNKALMIIYLIFWVIILRMFFFEEDRNIIHFLFGVGILGVFLYRYKFLSNQKSKRTQANITIFIAIVVFITIVRWYVIPFFM
ncbi:hypothetical protein [Bacillus alkalicellulosilyticus]|uniref:hypothetical protein n=1 Tax=Alkalihalobacterium alkalicellulosilyticum TaxID=1912214 RepID=UPI00099869DC|nr:hypothetical protein [Bacillus alkalicellulosilyticus]